MAGEAVTIAGGPLAGLVGIFQQHIPSRQRCRILLNVVGKLSPVEISESNLVPGGVL
jgi:transcription antitermination factor NusG